MKTGLIAFNKPFGVVCQFSAHETHRTLKSYIPEPGFYPAGRLDTDSEGLVLLTDDGRLQSRISDPKFKLPKTYLVQVEGNVTPEVLLMLRTGISLKEFTTAPATVFKTSEPKALWPRVPPIRERRHIPTSWLSITLCEGKNRQVRRMCAAAGFPCLRLIRVQIGPIALFDLPLPLGAWQFIQPEILRRNQRGQDL